MSPNINEEMFSSMSPSEQDAMLAGMNDAVAEKRAARPSSRPFLPDALQISGLTGGQRPNLEVLTSALSGVNDLVQGGVKTAQETLSPIMNSGSRLAPLAGALTGVGDLVGAGSQAIAGLPNTSYGDVVKGVGEALGFVGGEALVGPPGAIAGSSLGRLGASSVINGIDSAISGNDYSTSMSGAGTELGLGAIDGIMMRGLTPKLDPATVAADRAKILGDVAEHNYETSLDKLVSKLSPTAQESKNWQIPEAGSLRNTVKTLIEKYGFKVDSLESIQKQFWDLIGGQSADGTVKKGWLQDQLSVAAESIDALIPKGKFSETLGPRLEAFKQKAVSNVSSTAPERESITNELSRRVDGIREYFADPADVQNYSTHKNLLEQLNPQIDALEAKLGMSEPYASTRRLQEEELSALRRQRNEFSSYLQKVSPPNKDVDLEIFPTSRGDMKGLDEIRKVYSEIDSQAKALEKDLYGSASNERIRQKQIDELGKLKRQKAETVGTLSELETRLSDPEVTFAGIRRARDQAQEVAKASFGNEENSILANARQDLSNALREEERGMLQIYSGQGVVADPSGAMALDLRGINPQTGAPYVDPAAAAQYLDLNEQYHLMKEAEPAFMRLANQAAKDPGKKKEFRWPNLYGRVGMGGPRIAASEGFVRRSPAELSINKELGKLSNTISTAGKSAVGFLPKTTSALDATIKMVSGQRVAMSMGMASAERSVEAYSKSPDSIKNLQQSIFLNALKQFGIPEGSDLAQVPPQIQQQAQQEAQMMTQWLSDAQAMGDENDQAIALTKIAKLVPEAFPRSKSGIAGEVTIGGERKLMDPTDRAKYIEKIQNRKELNYLKKAKIISQLNDTFTITD